MAHSTNFLSCRSIGRAKQTGSYEQAFVDHEKEADEEKREKIQKWRSALTKVGNLAGYDLQKYG